MRVRIVHIKQVFLWRAFNIDGDAFRSVRVGHGTTVGNGHAFFQKGKSNVLSTLNLHSSSASGKFKQSWKQPVS